MSHLMLNSDLDPEHNYYNTIINYIDTCDYDDEDSFKRMAKGLYRLFNFISKYSEHNE